MTQARSVAALFVSLFSALNFNPGQQTVQQARQQANEANDIQRDSRALTVLQQAVIAMASTAPTDSLATGAIEITAGSKTTQGMIRIFTSGTNQTRREIETQDGLDCVIYSAGLASQKTSSTTQATVSLELAQSSQAAEFPLALLTGFLSNPDSALTYVGLETTEKRTLHHLRIWNTFASAPKMQELAEFSVRDVWLDSVSGLPTKLSYEQRNGEGAVPHIPLEVAYADYRNVSGVLYPFQISISLNGTPWASIAIQSVTFNSGLSSTNFQVR